MITLLVVTQVIHIKFLMKMGVGCDVYGKAIPLQAWKGPEGSRRLRLPDLMTVGT
jgi:hypothetical protein